MQMNRRNRFLQQIMISFFRYCWSALIAVFQPYIIIPTIYFVDKNFFITLISAEKIKDKLQKRQHPTFA